MSHWPTRTRFGPLLCSAGGDRHHSRREVFVRSAGPSIGLLLVLLSIVGCTAARQSTADVNAGLGWFVSPEHTAGWPRATDDRARLERLPLVVIAWGPVVSPETETSSPMTRAAKESWITAIAENLVRSGRVTRAEGSPPDTFEDGVTVAAVQALAAERQADLVVVFGLETTKRRYHAFGSPTEAAGSANPSRTAVTSVVEVVALGRMVGVFPSGVPLFSDTQKGFATGDIRMRTVEELEATSRRVAVDALGDAMIHRLSQVAPERGSR